MLSIHRRLGSLQSAMTGEIRETLVVWAIRFLLAVVAVLSAYTMLYGH